MDTAYTDATLQMINYLRGMAGLPGVTLNATLNEKAQQAALMMRAQNALSHSPPTTWACYSADGAEAAGRSNLYLGIAGPAAMAGYINDPGSNNTPLGHRRWMLYPPQIQMASGSTDRSNALWVLSAFGSRPTSPAWVSWPPAGFVPYSLVYPRWSLSKNDLRSWAVDFTQATVQMKSNGQLIPVSVQPVANGYGDNTLVWEPQGSLFQPSSLDVTYQVTVSNILIDGVRQEFAYQVTIIDPAIYVPDGIVPVADQYESNEDFLHAGDAGRGNRTLSALSIHALTDRDVFHWATDTTGAVTATVSRQNAVGALRLSLYDAQTRLLKQTQSDSATLVVTVQGNAGDSFFAVVESDGQTLIPVYDLQLHESPRPTANDDRGAAERDGQVTVHAIENDSSPGGHIEPGTLRAVSLPAHGSLAIDLASGFVTYTPDKGFVGLDKARYVVSDSLGSDSAPATISFTVLDLANHPWRNPTESLDVNGDGDITPIDVLAVVSYIDIVGAGLPTLDLVHGLFPPLYVDPSGDDFLSPIDALMVISFLNGRTKAAGDGEATVSARLTARGSTAWAEQPSITTLGPTDAGDDGLTRVDRLVPSGLPATAASECSTATPVSGRDQDGSFPDIPALVIEFSPGDAALADHDRVLGSLDGLDLGQFLSETLDQLVTVNRIRAL